MAAGRDLPAAVDPNAVHAGPVGEDPGVKDCIARLAGERGMVAVERDEIGRCAGSETIGGCAKRGRASDNCAIEQVASVGAARRRQHVAFPPRKALGIFELTQLVWNADKHIGIGADARSASVVEKERRREGSVPEVRLGDRTEACHGPARRHASRLVLTHVRCVDQTPASVNSGVVEKPFDGPCTRPGDAILDLAHLLGDMDVDRTVGREFDKGLQLPRRDRTQAVRGDAERRGRHAGREDQAQADAHDHQARHAHLLFQMAGVFPVAAEIAVPVDAAGKAGALIGIDEEFQLFRIIEE